MDKRADIWAFGAVLYEMLTGTRAFAGDDIADTLANVLKTEPDWARCRRGVAACSAGVARCLRKDPKQRVGDVRDVRLALEGAFETAAPQTTASATVSRGTWTTGVDAALAVAAVVIVALAVPAVRYLRETPPPRRPRRASRSSRPPPTSPRSFALSPDGRQIVFVASGDGASRLWLRSLATTTAQPLAGTEGATSSLLVARRPLHRASSPGAR